jgi:hypothetical protein
VKWRKGDTVIAVQEIVADDILHAEIDAGGVVVYVDSDGCPTVRFYNTGRSTIVGDHEVRKVGRQDCLECGEYVRYLYMVHDFVWRQAVPDSKGLLHLKCLEKRLGRQLRRHDFKDLEINELIIFGFLRGAADA